MPDQRTKFQKKLDKTVGMPLYYCADCMRGVEVTPVDGGEPVINRPCGEKCGNQIIAPRKAIVTAHGGATGMTIEDRIKTFYWRLGAALTGRCV